MQDFVIVEKGSEGLIRAKSKELGWDSVVLLYKYDGKIKSGSLKEDEGIFLDKKIEKDFSSFKIVVALGTSFERLPRGVTHVVMNEFEVEKDFIHQRRSGLNHVFLNEFKGSVLFAFSPLLKLDGVQGSERSLARQGQVIGRMMQNFKLCSGQVVSLASNEFEMRDVGDVKAFSRVLEKKL